MKKVVKISEKKLINFIKKSLNEYNNKIINKTNIVLNEQNNNDEWIKVDSEADFDVLKGKGTFEFRAGINPTSVANSPLLKTNRFIETSVPPLHTYYHKKEENDQNNNNNNNQNNNNQNNNNQNNNNNIILSPEEKAKLKKEQARQKSIEDAWEAVQIYGQENDLRKRAEFDSEYNEINYYLINGIKYYNDGFKVNGNDKKRYSKYDEIFENSPDDKINWTKKFPCVENYADEKDGEYDSKTNSYTIQGVIYKPTGKKSSNNGNTWVDFYCSDAELIKYNEQKKVTQPVKVNPQEKEDIPEPIINKYRF